MHLLPFPRLSRGAGKEFHLLQCPLPIVTAGSSETSSASRHTQEYVGEQGRHRYIGTSSAAEALAEPGQLGQIRRVCSQGGCRPCATCGAVARTSVALTAMAHNQCTWTSSACLWSSNVQALGTRRKQAPWGRGHPGKEQGKDREFPNVRAEGCLMLTLDVTDFSTLTQCPDRILG